MSSYDDQFMHIIQGSHNAYHANCRGRGQAELDWRNVDTVLLWGINVQASLKVVFGLRIIFLQDFKSGLNSFCCLSINLFLQMTVEQVKRLSLVNSTITHLPHQGFHIFLFSIQEIVGTILRSPSVWLSKAGGSWQHISQRRVSLSWRPQCRPRRGGRQCLQPECH